MLQIRAKILYNKKIGGYLHCSLNAPAIAKNARPGQFVNIKVTDGDEPLLRRPLGIHQVSANKVELLYEVLGKGTEVLSGRRAGEYLDIIGPLGKGFNYQLPVMPNYAELCRISRHPEEISPRITTFGTDYQLPLLVAGGMGVAPLLFLAEKLTEVKTQNLKRKSLVLIGARTKKQLLCAEEFKRLGCDVKIATDDGSRGFKGKVTDLLKNILRITNYQLRYMIYGCGPRPMLKEISSISKKYKIPAQISLEEHLACGIGACLGCVINTKAGYKRVCKEGPVFNADEIMWE